MYVMLHATLLVGYSVLQTDAGAVTGCVVGCRKPEAEVDRQHARYSYVSTILAPFIVLIPILSHYLSCVHLFGAIYCIYSYCLYLARTSCDLV